MISGKLYQSCFSKPFNFHMLSNFYRFVLNPIALMKNINIENFIGRTSAFILLICCMSLTLFKSIYWSSFQFLLHPVFFSSSFAIVFYFLIALSVHITHNVSVGSILWNGIKHIFELIVSCLLIVNLCLSTNTTHLVQTS